MIVYFRCTDATPDRQQSCQRDLNRI